MSKSRKYQYWGPSNSSEDTSVRHVHVHGLLRVRGLGRMVPEALNGRAVAHSYPSGSLGVGRRMHGKMAASVRMKPRRGAVDGARSQPSAIDEE